ncbi:hypothetical protein [Biostraticola tofi]|uniref:Uncharacterized protein n=1 Tax=Biostraticola tofi TaxID=466109 RepID=A0A4R3YZW6_9GAMM|nr:hypothetical protein [Biostraticola tofi]TCV98196.1 hypothetical protein EDC52_103283 [Biostraticola tofi]
MKTLGLILENILEEICTGKKIFAPEADTQEAIVNFQQTAKAISFADSEGLIEQCQFAIDEYTERLTFSRVMVTGGVTARGHDFLKKRFSERHQKVS